MKKQVLVLVFSNLKHDARVTRQVSFLAKNHHVTLVCFDADPMTNVDLVRIQQTKLTLTRKAIMSAALLLRQYSLAYRLFHEYEADLRERLSNKKFDLVVANDIDTLPLAFALKGKAKLIFDAHEYAPRHFENNLTWRIFFQRFYIYLCRKFIPETNAMLTVGQGLADEYEKNFGVKPVIITNAARQHALEPSAMVPEKIRLIHHGIANPSRRLELMIEMMGYLDERFSLDLMLMTSNYASAQTRAYIESLKSNAAKDGRIKILPSVASTAVVATINHYDMGVFLLPPVNFNYANTLPNKLFDFIQARLGIAIGPTPEMAAIVNQYQNGVVSADFTPRSLAAKLNSLTAADVARFKAQSAKAALVLNAERNEMIFNDLLVKIENA